ncbi:MAG: hypothetical protein HC799_08230 [Limnothrix sp. RL_2_0]|nr:hypothetical protein [Limnothrix sp. RL_2_0]
MQACFDDSTANDGTGDFACQILDFTRSKSGQSAFESASYVIAKNDGQPTIGTVPRGEAFQNLNMQEYGYAIHSVAKKTVASDSQLGASLKMDVKSRLIPMFQFAAFYANDLEILPGPEMNLRGPVHTNGSLYLGANDVLNVHNQVTLGGQLFNKRKNNNDTYSDGKVKIKDAAGNWLNLLSNGTGSTSQTANAMDSELIKSAWGTQVQVGMDPVIIPSPSFINKDGTYYAKADIRIEYKPAATATGNSDYLETVPFEIQVPIGDGTYQTLTEGQMRSLRQPVMVSRDLERANYCNASGAPNLTTITTDNEGRRIVVESLQAAIASQVLPLQFSSLNQALNTTKLADLRSSFEAILNTRLNSELGTLLNAVQLNLLASQSPAQIAAIAYDIPDPDADDGSTIPAGERCFVAAPLRDIGRDSGNHQSPYRYYNDRESKEMRLLQTNIESLTIWNKDGVFVDFNAGAVADTNGGRGFSTDELLFEKEPADINAPSNSFQNLGLAAADTSEGGFVIHATVDSTDYAEAGTMDSPYGFALTKGKQLMGLSGTASTLNNTGLTFVSDQAVYTQGDYNTVNKQPASILADSLNVLSNSCRNQDDMINKKSDKNCNPNINNENSKSNATTTIINSAFLAGTDITNSALTSGYNGGLENYPRFAENWSGDTLTYRGSFVSLGTPMHVSARHSKQKYNPPARDWEFDQDFNNVDNLPPLSPRFVYVRQASFERYLD